MGCPESLPDAAAGTISGRLRYQGAAQRSMQGHLRDSRGDAFLQVLFVLRQG